MQCAECGRDFERKRWWQHFCCPHCRDTSNNRRKKNEKQNLKDERYRCEVLAHEALLHGIPHLELVAGPPRLELKEPNFGRRPFSVEPKNEDEGQQEVERKGSAA